SHLLTTLLLRSSFGRPPRPSHAAQGLAPPPPLPRPPSPIPCRLGCLEPDDWPAIMQPAAFFSVSHWCHMYDFCPIHAARQLLLAPLGMLRRSKNPRPVCSITPPVLHHGIRTQVSIRISFDNTEFDVFLGLANTCYLSSITHQSSSMPIELSAFLVRSAVYNAVPTIRLSRDTQDVAAQSDSARDSQSDGELVMVLRGERII
ncbi:hypothetical protein CSPAE12_11523, partial [Colletotrichum incanum]